MDFSHSGPRKIIEVFALKISLLPGQPGLFRVSGRPNSHQTKDDQADLILHWAHTNSTTTISRPICIYTEIRPTHLDTVEFRNKFPQRRHRQNYLHKQQIPRYMRMHLKENMKHQLVYLSLTSRNTVSQGVLHMLVYFRMTYLRNIMQTFIILGLSFFS